MSEPTFFMYRDRPLVRKGRTIYYGSMTKRYVAMLNLEQQTEQNGIMTATLVRCYLMKTDPNLPPQDAIVQSKTTTRPTLYDAVELAASWLKQAGC